MATHTPHPVHARINLAPEVYQASQRAKQRIRLATSVGVGVCVVAIGLIIAGVVIVGGQKVGITALNNTIQNKQTEVKTNPDLQEAATAQQALEVLTTLNQNKVQFSKFFEVLQQFSPQGVAISKVSVTSDSSIDMTGTAKTYDLVTKLVKSLEGANVDIGDNAAKTNQPYFEDVTLGSVSQDSSGVTFKLTTNLSSEVFSAK